MTEGAGLVAQSSAAIRTGSKSFAAAARLFSRPTRESAVMLYAWCRHCDDAVDGQVLGHRTGAPAAAGAELERLRAKTEAALRGDAADHPAFAALQVVVQRHAIPARYPLAHLDGFAMDVDGRRYETLASTLDYAYHVAGIVGIMMAHVMGVRDERVLARACDLGLAFQLTNIARDVIEDAANGRVYLPEDWLAEAGIPAGEVAEPRHRKALAGVVRRLLDQAERYYASAAIGIGALPPRSAWAIATALRVYRQIGREVRARGPHAWDERVSTTAAQNAGHVVAGGAFALAVRLGRAPLGQERTGLWTPSPVERQPYPEV